MIEELYCPFGEVIKEYWVTGLPPLDEGAFQLMVAWPFPAIAVTLVGAPGTVKGVTALEGDEADPYPAVFAAVTVKE